MFNTFVGVECGDNGHGRTGHRRDVVGRACVECRRRKTKCSGAAPCSSCAVCGIQCVFPESRRRGKLPRKTVAESKNAEYSAVFNRLFGDVSIQSLKDLSRNELLELICMQDGNPPGSTAPPTASSPGSIPLADESRHSPTREASVRLQQLQLETSSLCEWDEVSVHPQKSVEDDVNGLSLSLNRKSSYVGISSVTAAVRALAKVIPNELFEQTAVPSRKPAEERPSSGAQPGKNLCPNQGSRSSYHEQQRLIDSYFATIHVFAPVIHEPTFRNNYLSRSRSDPPWLALLNIVLALGSVAISSGDSDEDFPYYQEAQKYLDLESFGTGRLETLQALILMGGMYLHYRNRPNMASAIMGACYRVACGLGLHFDAAESSQETPSLAAELKRRIWWTIYVLDIWGSVTLGRPVIASGSSPDLPRNLLDDQHGDVPHTEPTVHSPLIHNIQLCRIITRIQDRLLASPILNIAELDHYDNMLVSWFKGLPDFLRSTEIPAPYVQDARAVLKWRYQNIRLLLHRPLVLDTLLRQAPFYTLTPEEQTVVKKCRELAAEAIMAIQCEWRTNKISCWNGIWFLFQACLISIMAVAVEPPETEDYQSWIAQAQGAIATCGNMSDLTLAGHKTKAFLEKLLQIALKLPNVAPENELHEDAQEPLQSMMEMLSDEWDVIARQEFFPDFNCPILPDLDGSSASVFQQDPIP